MKSEFLKNIFTGKKETPEKEVKKIELTKSKVCEILGIEFDGEDEEYNELSYGRNSSPGDLAIIQRVLVSPMRLTPKRIRIDIADAAMERGAKMLLGTSKIKDYPCLIVPSPIIDSVVKLVHGLWKDLKPMTLEVTGSYGKTTVVSMLEAVLGVRHKVFGHNADSLNMVPHTVKRVQDWDGSYDVFIQEAAEAAHSGVPGVISRMIEPDICIVTNVGTSHIEIMGSQEEIFRSCISIEEGMAEDGVLILNGDDPFLVKAETNRKTVYYGMYNENVDFRAVNGRSTEDGIEFDIIHDGTSTHVSMDCIGLHNAQNAAAVFAAAKVAGMSDEDAAKGLSLFHPSGYRQRLFRAGKYHFYLDCYNASVESMKSALDGIRDMEIPEGAKRIAVLSDIAQAGDHTEEFHSEVGRYAAESNLDILICQGENAETVAKEAKADPELKIYIAGSREDAERLLEEIVTERDIVLLKGSHSTKLHTIPDDLLGTWFSESGGRKILNEGSEYIVFSELGTGYLRSADKTLDNFVIPEKIEDMIINGIGEESFKGSALRSISIPETIRNIRKGAFEGSRKLKNIALPGSVMYIDDEAFKDCTGLREVVLTDNIRHISDSAFEGCKKLHFICSEGSYAYNYALRMGLKIKN